MNINYTKDDKRGRVEGFSWVWQRLAANITNALSSHASLFS